MRSEQQFLELIYQETGVLATMDTLIEKLGIDSLEFLSLLQVLRQQGNVMEQRAIEANTVRDLFAAVRWN